MIRSVFFCALAATVIAGPPLALAQTTDMVTYADTMRKKSGGHSSVHPVNRGPAAKHAAAGKHSVGPKHAVAAKSAGAKGKHHK
jgi:predicted cobalt transporter CbtA